MRQYSWHQAKQLLCQDCQKKGHGKIGKIETEIAQHLERESRHCCSAISSIYLFRYNRTGDLGAFKLKLHCHGNCTNGAAAAKQEIYFFHRLPESYNLPKKGGTSPPPPWRTEKFSFIFGRPNLNQFRARALFCPPSVLISSFSNWLDMPPWAFVCTNCTSMFVALQPVTNIFAFATSKQPMTYGPTYRISFDIVRNPHKKPGQQPLYYRFVPVQCLCPFSLANISPDCQQAES